MNHDTVSESRLVQVYFQITTQPVWSLKQGRPKSERRPVDSRHTTRRLWRSSQCSSPGAQPSV